MIFVKQIEIVEIAADFLCRVHCRVNFKIGTPEIKIVGQHALLNIRRDVQLGGNALIFGSFLRQIRLKPVLPIMPSATWR